MPRAHVVVHATPADVPNWHARLDVTAFVGFAAAGPLDTPVLVEDVTRYREIFGEDLTLAWDGEAGVVHTAYLGPAVRTFFRNGGRRCWVVRVAGPTASSNRFLVPGLMRATSDGGYRCAVLQARSEGSWSDGLLVETVMQRARLGQTAVTVLPDGRGSVRVTKGLRDRVQPGDLLRLEFAEDGVELFLLAEAIESAYERHAAPGAQHFWQVSGRQFWFETAGPLPAPARELRVRYRNPLADPLNGSVADPAGAATDEIRAFWLPPAAGQYRLFLELTLALGSGSLLEVPVGRGRHLLLSLFEVRLATWEDRADWAAAPAGDFLAVTGRDARWPLLDSEGWSAVHGRQGMLERLSFDLWAEQASKRQHIPDLGFAPSHERFIGHLPTDASLFRLMDERRPRPDGPEPGSQIRAAAAAPRFPLAAVREQPGEIFLPIGMDFSFRREEAAHPLPDHRPQQWRNGMGEFSPDVFLDPDLKDVPPASLTAEAVRKRHVHGRRLQGLHAVWPLEEVTLLCLPDCFHPGWFEETLPEALAAPELRAAAVTAGGLTVAWEPVWTATAYRVETAADVEFRVGLQKHWLTGTALALAAPASTPQEVFCRVRAERPAGWGPWSNTLRFWLPQPAFTPQTVVSSPDLTSSDIGSGRYLLQWGGEGADSYTLQIAHTPDFRDPRVVHAGPETDYAVWREGEVAGYYRVRATWQGQVSPWSRTVTLDSRQGRSAWKLQPPAVHDIEGEVKGRLAVHKAALCLARARGDILAVLALPRHFRDPEVAVYSRVLAAELAEEEVVLGYGAVFHPWVTLREGESAGRLVPPDALITALTAAEAVARRPWAPPTSQLSHSAAGLDYLVGRSGWQLLRQERINVLRQEPRGVVLAGHSTLSLSPPLQPIGVRRLLSLLRRLVWREGAHLVFEPNDEGFRQLASHRFERLLADLYRQGAFAGATPEESYQVLAGPELNTPDVIEQGCFIVEIRIAPLEPLTFTTAITVRMIQSQGGPPAVTEV